MMKTVLITGASRGIGAETARLFAKAGYAVAVNFCHNQKAADAVVADIIKAGGDAFAVQADVSNADSVASMMQEVTHRLGKIDVLVHNAGISLQKLLTDTNEHEWHRMIGIHLDGAYLCSRAVIPAMVHRQYGRIITVSSMWGEVGASCEVAYSAAKAGLIGFTKALAKELGPSGITVNCVAPGVIDTDMCAALSDETRKELADETPLCRLGTPEDVAKAILFLASDDAAFITGQTLGVNGGYIT